MKKQYFLIIIFVILFSSFAYAQSELNNELIHYFNGSNTLNQINDFDLTNNGASFGFGKIGLGYDCDSGDYLYNDSLNLPTVNFSYSFWINTQSFTGNFIGILSRVSATTNPDPVDIFIRVDTPDRRNFYVGDGVSATVTDYLYNVVFDGGFNMWTFVKNGTNGHIYLNNSLVATDDLTGQSIADNNNREFRICEREDTAVSTDAIIDEISIYNRSLGIDDISLLWNNGDGISYPFVDENITVETITINSDLKNTQNINAESIRVNFNATLENTDKEIFTCELFNNDTIIDFLIDINLTNNQNYFFNFSVPRITADYFLKMQCRYFEQSYNVTDYKITKGNLIGGVVSNLNEKNDNLYLSFSEVPQSPSLNISFNLTDVREFANIFITYNYTRINNNYDTAFYIYNYTSNNYDRLFNLRRTDNLIDTSDNRGFLNLNGDYVNNNVSEFKILNTISSSSSNKLYIDYIQYRENNLSDETNTFTYKVDRVEPQIKVESDFINNTVYNINDVQGFYANFSDDNLYAYNINFTRLADNKVIENIFATGLNVTFAENRTSRILDTKGDYSIILEAWDSHTNNEIKNYKIDKLHNGLEFNDNIKITSDNVEKSNTIKLKDRYIFILNLENKSDNLQIRLSSKSELDYIENDKYMMHFVDFTNQKWLDFDNNFITDYEVTKITNNEYILNINFDREMKAVTFNSIGDLNFKRIELFYSVVEPLEAQTQAITDLGNKIEGGINMLWFWIVFIVNLFLPKFREEEDIYFLQALVFMILFISLATLNFSYPIWARNLILTVLVVLSLKSMTAIQSNEIQ